MSSKISETYEYVNHIRNDYSKPFQALITRKPPTKNTEVKNVNKVARIERRQPKCRSIKNGTFMWTTTRFSSFWQMLYVLQYGH